MAAGESTEKDPGIPAIAGMWQSVQLLDLKAKKLQRYTSTVWKKVKEKSQTSSCKQVLALGCEKTILDELYYSLKVEGGFVKGHRMENEPSKLEMWFASFDSLSSSFHKHTWIWARKMGEATVSVSREWRNRIELC